MKLIREEIESVDFLVESVGGKKSMFIEGIFLQGDLQNRNGRMYPMNVLRKEVQRYNENLILCLAAFSLPKNIRYFDS